MTPKEYAIACSQLASASKAVDTLRELGLISVEEMQRITRKFVDDRPEFKAAVSVKFKSA